MDSADIAALNDFNDEIVTRARSNAKKPLVPRGVCLNCSAKIADTLIYCDDECKADFEAYERVMKRTHT